MGCFSSSSSKSKFKSTTNTSQYDQTAAQPLQYQEPPNKNVQQQILLQIPGCRVHLMEEGEALELAVGEFILENIFDENISLATVIKVGEELQWPLTKDEPVVKIDDLHYLFSLPMRDGDPLSYGVTFPEQYASHLGFLDSFLKEHSCFTITSNSSATKNVKGVDWKEYAPRIDDYNNVLAKAIAGGTGQIVRGIFMCSNAYANQLHKGGETTLARPVEEKRYGKQESHSKNSNATNKSGMNRNLKRVRRLSKMTSNLSKSMLDGVGLVTGSVMKPVVKSQAGKAFLNMVPGQVLLASLDAINKILDAAEVAEKQALSATSAATTRMVSNRYGESAGEATEHTFATAGHCANTAWNIFKIRKAINPASSVKTGVLNAAKNKNKSS
ncbi:senescence/dehydration-associated protein At4g35985, chloroplastic-like [Rosa rugosa]|uniref:senescence/dehydration-associated protein At4g35985, chloroplastic-like n=1 Tax=Rosa rugosa TaxID=74645 RepID=UPI002B40B3AC|nr:senescence/dehydration-associated protein At4g35985, chloroplastic-like [Rosa rugosa]